MNYRLAFLGFGNVGRALAELLLAKRDELKSIHDITFTVTGIATARHGQAVDASGIDLPLALELGRNGRPLNALSAGPVPDNFLEFIRCSGADLLFENTPVNYETGQPAVDHLRTALELGMHAVTANKGAVVHAYHELSELARVMGRHFFFESTVMDGAPIFSLFRSALPVVRCKSFEGVLNSTTNLILTRMETGESFEDAIAYARQTGFAETDPAGDIDGHDAAIKVAALMTVLMNTPTKPGEVAYSGIRDISMEMVADAKANGERYKLICSAEFDGQKIRGRVAPRRVSSASRFYGIEGTSSMIHFETDVLGEFSLVENDPGPQTTAYGLLADFINAVRN
jgi:homoserine dehydrogenase